MGLPTCTFTSLRFESSRFGAARATTISEVAGPRPNGTPLLDDEGFGGELIFYLWRHRRAWFLPTRDVLTQKGVDIFIRVERVVTAPAHLSKGFFV